jgi:hypothetical protein
VPNPGPVAGIAVLKSYKILLETVSKSQSGFSNGLEAVSRPQIRFEGKARANEKAEHIR